MSTKSSSPSRQRTAQHRQASADHSIYERKFQATCLTMGYDIASHTSICICPGQSVATLRGLSSKSVKSSPACWTGPTVRHTSTLHGRTQPTDIASRYDPPRRSGARPSSAPRAGSSETADAQQGVRSDVTTRRCARRAQRADELRADRQRVREADMSLRAASSLSDWFVLVQVWTEVWVRGRNQSLD